MRLAVVLISVFLIFEVRAFAHAESLYKTLCAKAAETRNQVRVYESDRGEYILNIQMLETYKHFRGCRSMDPNVKMDPSFNAQLNLIENEFQKQQDPNPIEWESLNQRSLEIFKQTQALYREYLEQLIRKDISPVRREVLNQIKERVNTVRINKSRYCGSFNSNYNSVSHSIDTCNELLTYPRTTLIAIYAHELTHSIGPCSLQFSLLHIEKENPFSSAQMIFEGNKLNDAYTALPFNWAQEDLFLDADQIKTQMSPLEFRKNPFRGVLSCLQSNKSIQAQKRKNSIEKAMVKDEEQMCSSSLKDGQMEESFADWMAYEVLAHFFEKEKDSDLSKQIFEGTLNIVANECKPIESDIEMKMREAIMTSEKCKSVNESFFNFQKNLRSQKLIDTHPHGWLRIDKLYGVQPTLKRLTQNYLKADFSLTSGEAIYCKY